MNILVTGAKGFVGKNLVENLKTVRDGKDKRRADLAITDIFEYDRDTDTRLFETYCKKADFIFHLAGVNRPEEPSEFMDGNAGFSEKLLDTLKMCHNTCPVMFASSSQAALTGRFAGSEYGKSKRAGEGLFFHYAKSTGARVLVYRFPNLFGKWCRPNYNSAVATFCNAIANGLEYTVHDRSIELELVYIDDLVNEMLDALEGREHRCTYQGDGPVPDGFGKYCYVPVTHRAGLGKITGLLEVFRSVPETLLMPQLPEGSFEKKLYSTYLSYLPMEKMAYRLQPHINENGSFTELLKLPCCGQVSVNIIKPGVTKGQHWHNSKWEIFFVVSGYGLIQQQKVGIDPGTGKAYPVCRFEAKGSQMQAVQMLPGYTHSITNLSDSQDLVTVIWANEQFDAQNPDTFYEPVVLEGKG